MLIEAGVQVRVCARAKNKKNSIYLQKACYVPINFIPDQIPKAAEFVLFIKFIINPKQPGMS